MEAAVDLEYPRPGKLQPGFVSRLEVDVEAAVAVWRKMSWLRQTITSFFWSPSGGAANFMALMTITYSSAMELPVSSTMAETTARKKRVVLI
jgi:hypothetical protein